MKRLTGITTAFALATLLGACNTSPTGPAFAEEGTINGTNVPIHPIHYGDDQGELQPLNVVPLSEGTRMGTEGDYAGQGEEPHPNE
jgi:hypothetical protein